MSNRPENERVLISDEMVTQKSFRADENVNINKFLEDKIVLNISPVPPAATDIKKTTLIITARKRTLQSKIAVLS